MAAQHTGSVLGIDPGLNCTGWGLVATQGGQQILLASGAIRTSSSEDFLVRLDQIYQQLREVIHEHQPAVLAVEDVIYAANVRIALKLGHARGAILLAAAHSSLPVASYAPKEIKQAVSGNGNASKEQVQRMVQSILGLRTVPSPNDIADAIAVALCHINRSRFAHLG